AVVSYTVGTGGGCPPINVVCNPPSGSTFPPIGITTVNCTAGDSCNSSATCTFTVTVRPPSISITPIGGQIQLNWSTGTLQEADDSSGPYIDVDPQPTPPYTITPSQRRRFFRLRI